MTAGLAHLFRQVPCRPGQPSTSAPAQVRALELARSNLASPSLAVCWRCNAGTSLRSARLAQYRWHGRLVATRAAGFPSQVLRLRAVQAVRMTPHCRIASGKHRCLCSAFPNCAIIEQRIHQEISCGGQVSRRRISHGVDDKFIYGFNVRCRDIDL